MQYVGRDTRKTVAQEMGVKYRKKGYKTEIRKNGRYYELYRSATKKKKVSPEQARERSLNRAFGF